MLEQVETWIRETKMSLSMFTSRVITSADDCSLRIQRLKVIESQLNGIIRLHDKNIFKN